MYAIIWAWELPARVLYYVILQILLKLQGKVLDTYQGINSMEQMGSGMGILATIKEMYVDFLAFTVHGNVLVNNIFSLGGLHYFSGNGSIFSDPQDDLEKMVEESGIFRYNDSVGASVCRF